MQKTKIEYLTHVWNPIAMRCDRVSAGCDNCWHIRMAKRMAGIYLGKDPQIGSSDRMRLYAYNGGKPWLNTSELSAPFKLRKPAVIGVQFMGDLFHESIPLEWIASVYGVIAANPRHQFVVLTKRVDRAGYFYRWVSVQVCADIENRQATECAFQLLRQAEPEMEGPIHSKWGPAPTAPWPLENLIIGTSVENQQTADDRIPKLLEIPAWKRMVSFEPALGPVEFNFATECDRNCNEYKEAWCPGTYGKCLCQWDIDILVAGAETGPGVRPADLDWFRSARGQCAAAGVPFFLKQVSAKGDRELDGILHEDWIERER